MDDTQGFASPQSLSQCFKSSWFRWEAQRLAFVGTKSGILICGRAESKNPAWHQLSTTQASIDARAWWNRHSIAVFLILADRSKNNLQSKQLLIGRQLVSGQWMAAVHLFSTVVLVGIDQN